MIKYRVYDEEQKKYLEPLHTRILGNGNLAISSDEFGIEMVRTIAAEGIEHSGYIVEQYTGLKDKNGVEIAVGDILMDDTGEPIEYWSVNLSLGEFFGECSGVAEGLFELTGLEVIGNIHDNADLLEEKQ